MSVYRNLVVVLAGLAALAGRGMDRVTSPDGTLEIGVETEGALAWQLTRKGAVLVQPSPLGLVFAEVNGPVKEIRQPLVKGMRVIGRSTRAADATWTTMLYKRETVRDRYNELKLELEEEAVPHRRLNLVFRAYDEGAAFRYEVPEQAALPGGFQLLEEATEWRFPGACSGRFTSSHSVFNSSEDYYLRRAIADVKPVEYLGAPAVVDVAGQKVALTEAALSNWAGIYFRHPAKEPVPGVSTLAAYLTPLPPTEASTPKVAVIRTTPAASPWRVTMCAESDLDLTRKTDILVNLNPPPEPGLDFSWVKAGASTWDWWVESNNSLSTDLTLKLVDFAAEAGWPYHTIDGGWYGFARRPNHGPDVKLEPRPGFDLARIVAHAKEKGVGIWVWIHWMEIDDTGIEETFARLEKWGVRGVKTDFLNRQDQWMVCWYERVLRAAARHHVMVNFHGAFKPTGTERTWPNNLTREAVLGNEMNIFNTRITPEHCATLPFTRFLLGPADFTPGSFANRHQKDFVPQVKKGHRYGDETDRCPYWAEEMGTRAAAIAKCIVFDSRLMTLCDWPERYRGAAGFEALRNLPAAWRETEPIAGACGEYYVARRTAFSGRHYVAGFTVKARTVKVPLAFLGSGTHTATLYLDDPAKTPRDAKAIAVTTRSVTAADTLTLDMCDEGGAVVMID